MKLLLSIAISLTLISCSSASEQGSEPSFNIDYDITPGVIKKAKYLKTSVVNLLTPNAAAVNLRAADLVLFDLSGAEYNKINAAFPKAAVITCDQAKRRCRGQINGAGVQTALSKVSQADKMSMGKVLNVSMRYIKSNGHSYIEVCRVSGIKFQKLFMWQPLDGFLLKFGKDGSDVAEKLAVDLGAGGSYPTAKCDY